MTNHAKSNLIIILGSIGSVFIFFCGILIFGESGTGVIVGIVMALPLSVYSIFKSYKLEAGQQPTTTTTITTTYVFYGETKSTPQEIILNLPKQPITLNPSEGFMYKGMYEEVSYYFKKVLNSKASHGMIDVCLNVPNVKPSKHVVMQFMEDSDLENGEPFDIGIYFFPDCFSSEYGERFRQSFYWESCFKDSSRPDENTYLAYFGDDIATAVHIASYILATVYYIPLNTVFSYDFDTIS